MNLTRIEDSFENNLQRFEQNGLELIIDVSTGEVFSSRNALARMCTVDPSTITRWKGSAKIKTINAEIPTNGGFQGGDLYDEDAIYSALEKYKPSLLKQCAKMGLRMYLHGLAGFKYQVIAEPLIASKDVPQESAKEMYNNFCEITDLIFKGVNIKPELVAGLKINQAQRMFPQLSDGLLEHKQLLRNNTATEFELLTPTQLGQKMGGISGQKVNKLLIEHGLQVKNENKTSKKDLSYEPTPQGQEFSTITLSTGKNGDSTSYQQLLWYESVLNIIE